jgi:hypothetical protein
MEDVSLLPAEMQLPLSLHDQLLLCLNRRRTAASLLLLLRYSVSLSLLEVGLAADGICYHSLAALLPVSRADLTVLRVELQSLTERETDSRGSELSGGPCTLLHGCCGAAPLL